MQRPPSSFATFESLESRQFLTTYYVSPSGSDGAAGTSPSHPWHTIDRVNEQTLHAGDLVLFKGGKIFRGSLYVPSREGGTGDNPVIFSNYGRGKASIYSGSKPGIDVAQTAGVAITNLTFVGSGPKTNKSSGIYIHSDYRNQKLSYIHIRNVEVRKYGKEAIFIDAAAQGSSFSNIKVKQARLHDNLFGGLKISGSKNNGNKNVVVDHVLAYNNAGSNKVGKRVTGSGIFISDTDGVLVQYSVASNNGRDGSAPVGIWAASSNRVVFQHNESYNNHTHTISDGGGFDFDWDVTNSVMQYNYSHDNDGPGFLLYAGSHSQHGNTIRYNVTENDGRKNGKAGIQVGGNVSDADIHNNTVFFSSTGKPTSAAFQTHDWGSNGKVPKNISVRNNIFHTTGGANIIYATDNVVKKGSFSFAGNAYFADGDKLQIKWGSNSYKSVGDWRKAKGQEKVNGKATGYEGNPKALKDQHRDIGADEL